MNLKKLFGFGKADSKADEERSCKKCGGTFKYSALAENNMVCPECGTYMRMGAWERLGITVDENSFTELYGELQSRNIIDFPEYEE